MQNKASASVRSRTIRLILGTLLVLGFVALGAWLFTGETPNFDEPSGYYINLFTELIGIAVTVFFVNELARYREDTRLIDQLVMKAKSKSNSLTIEAIDELRHNNWLVGKHGALQGANLKGTDLANAELQEANLREADLEKADLHEADLGKADLQEAILRSANLQSADLKRADLQGARLEGANLYLADLEGTNLRGANLEVADLQGAVLYGARLQRAVLRGVELQNAFISPETQFDEDTTLPDGTRWTPDVDWSRFGAFTDLDTYTAWKRQQPANP